MVETLFFKTYHAFLLGNLSDTKMFFEFLQEEFKLRKDPHALSNKQLIELKTIRSAIQTGKIETQEWITEAPTVPTSTGDAPDIKQTELTRKIHYQGFMSLQELLRAPGLELYNLEHPCGVYGAVDMVYRNEKVIFPVEVKRYEGKHDLIGQISKYTLHFKLNLHLKHYEEVQPVTICNSYNQHTLNELKKLKIIPIKYDLFGEELKMRIL